MVGRKRKAKATQRNADDSIVNHANRIVDELNIECERLSRVIHIALPQIIVAVRA